jgi:hypothetical protein
MAESKRRDREIRLDLRSIACSPTNSSMPTRSSFPTKYGSSTSVQHRTELVMKMAAIYQGFLGQAEGREHQLDDKILPLLGDLAPPAVLLSAIRPGSPRMSVQPA